jgi:hypothetical protein
VIIGALFTIQEVFSDANNDANNNGNQVNQRPASFITNKFGCHVKFAASSTV